MHRFYLDYPLIVGQIYSIPQKIYQHFKALRILQHNHVVLFNGDGIDYLANIIKINTKECCVFIQHHSINLHLSPCKIILIMSMIAKDKMALVVQKATELGVSHFIPIYSARTQYTAQRLQEDVLIKHWKNIVISASEQSGRASLMTIQHFQHFNAIVACADLCLDKTIQHTIQKAEKVLLTLPNHASDVLAMPTKIDTNNGVALMIGPEGGFTIEETEQTLIANFQPITIGNTILRAETAAIAGISILYAYDARNYYKS